MLSGCAILAMTAAVGYVRTSSAANVGFGKDSESRQKIAISECAEARGLIVVDFFDDPAVSGADHVVSRDGFARMIDHCLQQQITTIIFEDATRFARDLIVQEQGYRLMTEQGFKLLAASSPDAFLDDGPSRVFIRQVLGAAAEFQKSEAVLRLQGARRRSAERKQIRTLRGTNRSSGPVGRLNGPDGAVIRSVIAPFVAAGKLKYGNRQSLRHALFDAGIRTANGECIPADTVKMWCACVCRMPKPSGRRLRGKKRRLEVAPPEVRHAALLDSIKQDVFSLLQPSRWSAAASSYRNCVSLYFGLGVPRNRYHARASHEMPGLESKLVQFFSSFGMAFTSVVINKYGPGDEMGAHVDDNALGHHMQVVVIFGTYEGGDLLIQGPDGTETRLGNGVHKFNASLSHRVSEVTSGTRYSAISYAKRISKVPSETVTDLKARGFVMPE